MNYELAKYVMPLFRRMGDERSFAGTAFCIDDYLVTAGHVINAAATYYVRNGLDWHPLQYDRWIPRQLPTIDKRGYDVALYPIPGLTSPFTLAEADAEPLDALDVLCWQWLPQGLQQVATRCLVLNQQDEDGYRQVSTVDRITHGCSGCPVMSDGLVYGIITMGRDHVDTTGMGSLKRSMEQNTCWIFKVSHMRRFLPR